jgi:hypothetical protein
LRIRSLLAAAILLSPNAAAAQKPTGSIEGTWEGESICTVRDSPCHDEHVIYEISPDSPIESSPNRLGSPREWKIDAYKIVDGKKDFMGTLPCSYEAQKQTLSCITKTRTEGYWEFIFAGEKFNGTLHLGRDKTLFRKVSAKRISKS